MSSRFACMGPLRPSLPTHNPINARSLPVHCLHRARVPDPGTAASRRDVLSMLVVTTTCSLQAAKAAEEGSVRYVDISNNPALTDKETKAILNNLKIQAQNQVPDGFPTFVREGFDVKVLGQSFMIDPNGLIYRDFVEGDGSSPTDYQQVIFDYTGYNENGRRIDSSYLKGEPSTAQLGMGTLIPGFEVALKGMKVGGRRRIIIPPALGPPVGPSTFFSAKQCEVFDVELRQIRNCQQQQFAMFSRTVCE